MANVGRSTRFRSIALTVLAAGGVFLPVAVLALGSLGWLPTPSAAETVDSRAADEEAERAAYGASGVLPLASELNPALLATIASPGASADLAVTIPEGALTIPPAALAAYHRAEEALALQQPGCQVKWTLLAGLGRVISDHGSGSLDPTGNSTQPILGPRLDGSPGLASIRDTDGGRVDTDAEWDRASGPMQIIPSVWRRVGGDSDGDGFGSPHNVFDAALGAGRYLCEGGASLTDVAEQARAVFRYQRSDIFVRTVMAWTLAYGPRTAPTEEPPVELPPVEQIAPSSKTPPPTGALPQGRPLAPASAIPPSSPPPTTKPGAPTGPPPSPPTTQQPPTGPTTNPPTNPQPPTTGPTGDPTTNPQPPTGDPTTNPQPPTTNPTADPTPPTIN